jgi:hypothetical protein
MKREPCLVFHRSDHGRVHANIPPPHRDCNPRGTQRRAGHLAELEEPKEGGSYGDASMKVNGTRMCHHRRQRQRSCKVFTQTQEPPPLELGLGPDHNTTSSPGVGIGTSARATTRRRPSKAPQGTRKEVSYRSKPCKSSQADVARGLRHQREVAG